MGVESAADRVRKRIVEHIIGEFASAFDAISFGNQVKMLAERRVGRVKFRQSIGSPDSKIAITEAYNGPTVLKTCFLELDQDKALYIIGLIQEHLKTGPNLRIYKGATRGKPQPQRVETRLIPRSTNLNQIGR